MSSSLASTAIGPRTTPSVSERSPGQRVSRARSSGDAVPLAVRARDSEDIRAHVHDQIYGNPDTDHEVPIERVVRRVAHSLDGHALEPVEQRQPDGVRDVEYQECRVASNEEPGGAPIGIRIPAHVERPELVPAQNRDRE